MTSGDNGGWRTDSEAFLSSSRCNIRRVHKRWQNGGISAEDFRKHFGDEPVIVVGAKDNSRCRDVCRKDALLAAYGDHEVILSSANTFSHDKLEVPFREYLGSLFAPQDIDTPANNSWYLFGDNNHKEWEAVFSEYQQPEYILDDERLGGFTAALSFGIGASGTGVPFHVHGPGFSEVLWGRKRWFLTHKDEKPDFSPDETTLMWLRTRYYSIMQSDFRGKLFECTIGPGEALYFPDHWWHATLNIGETVFMSTFT